MYYTLQGVKEKKLFHFRKQGLNNGASFLTVYFEPGRFSRFDVFSIPTNKPNIYGQHIFTPEWVSKIHIHFSMIVQWNP